MSKSIQAALAAVLALACVLIMPAQADARSSRVERSPRAMATLNGVHPRLVAFARHFNLTVISGYRPGARVAGTRRLSNHARGLAIDARGARLGAAVRHALRNGMGVGTYARCTGHSHVHFSLVASERYHRGCGRAFKSKRKHRRR